VNDLILDDKNQSVAIFENLLSIFFYLLRFVMAIVNALVTPYMRLSVALLHQNIAYSNK